MTATENKDKVYINEYGLIEIIVHGDQTVESVNALADKTDDFVHKFHSEGKPALVLDNLMLLGNAPSNVRKTVIKRIRNAHIDKFAFVGTDRMLRLGSNLVLRAIGKGNSVKYFDDYGTAVTWLQEK